MEDKAVEVKIGEELDDNQLNKYLKTQISGFIEISEILQFPGGYSNLTYLIKTANSNYILRKAPKGATQIKGGHNMEREFGILKSLQQAGFAQIPTPIVFCGDESVLNADFYLMEKIDGTILRVANLKEFLKILQPDLLLTLSVNLCETLAQMHKIDIKKTGLVNIGKPEGYIARQVSGWQNRYVAAQTDEIEDYKTVSNWLTSHQPAEIEPALLHNDFKYDNVIFDIKTQKIKAILDWEMATVGDPRMDIGTCLSYWAEAADDDFCKTFNLTWLPGNLTRGEFVNLYQKINPIDLSDILYFYVFGLFKNAIIIQQIYSRYQKGLTQDKRFKNLIQGVKILFSKAKNSIENNKMV